MTTPTSTSSATAFAFPISLDLTGRRCVVAGAGALAREKADALRQAGADVVELPAGGFTPEELDGAFLLIVSGEDDTDAAAAFAEAERRGVLVNALDDIPHCHFAFPSVLRRGDLKLAISTNGRAPALARRIRLDLEEQLPEALDALVEACGEAREAALPRRVPFEVWASAWRAALTDLDVLLALCEQGRAHEARDRILAGVNEANAADDVVELR